MRIHLAHLSPSCARFPYYMTQTKMLAFVDSYMYIVTKPSFFVSYLTNQNIHVLGHSKNIHFALHMGDRLNFPKS